MEEKNSSRQQSKSGKENNPHRTAQSVGKKIAKKNHTKPPVLSSDDFSKLAPPSGPGEEIANSQSSVNLETEKIVRIGVQREFIIHEKEKEIQEANVIIKNLRKNIHEMQMENEKLDQTYRREISCRNELVTRQTNTKEKLDAIFQYSKTLAESIRTVEEDKKKIELCCNAIHINHEEIRTRLKRTEVEQKNENDLVQKKIHELEQACERKINQYLDGVNQMQKKYNQVNNKAKLESEKNRLLSSQLTEIMSTKEKLKNLLEESNQNTSKHVNEISTLQKKIEEIERNFRALEEEKKNILQEKNDLVSNLASADNLNLELLETNKKLKEESDQIKNEMDDLFASYERLNEEKKKVQELNDTCLEEKNALSLKINELEKLNESIALQNDKISKSEAHLQCTLNALQCELLQKSQELSEAQASLLNLSKEKDKLQGLITSLEEADVKSKAQDEKRTNELKDLEKRLLTHSETIDRMTDQIGKLNEELSCERHEKKKVIDDKEEISKALEAQVAGLSKIIGNLQETIKVKESIINDFGDDVNKKSHILETLSIKLENETLKSKNYEKSIEDLKSKIESERSAYEELRRMLEKTTLEKDSLATEVKNIKTVNINLNEKLKSKISTLEGLNREKQRIEKAASEIISELSIQQDEEDSRLDVIMLYLKKVHAGNLESFSKIEELEKCKDENETQLQAYREMLKKYENEIRAQNKEESNEIARLKSELETLKQSKLNVDNMLKRRLENPFNLSGDQREGKNVDKESAGNSQRNSSRIDFTPQKTIVGMGPPQGKQSALNKSNVYDFDSDDSTVEQYSEKQVNKYRGTAKLPAPKRLRK